jgi:hypothetical protein
MWFFYIFCCSVGAYLIWRKRAKTNSATAQNLDSMSEEELRHNLQQLEMEENRQNLFNYSDNIPATIRRIVFHELPFREDEKTNMKNKLLQSRDPLRNHKKNL